MSDTRDHEWLLVRERGGDVSHVAAATQAPYEKLGELLAKLPGVAPRAGWQQRVFAAIDAGDAASPRPALAPPKPVLAPPKPARRRQWIAAGAVAMAAAAAIAIYVARRPAPLQLEAMISSEPPSQPLPQPASQPPPSGDLIALTAEVRDGDGTPRSRDGARLNDKYVIRLETAGPAELRLYGDTQELLATCSGGEPGCTIERDGERRRFSFEVVLRWPGEVRLVAFVGAQIPASTGELARDQVVAAQAGVKTKEESPFVVH